MYAQMYEEEFKWIVHINANHIGGLALLSEKETDINRWLSENIHDDNWFGFENTSYANGRKPLFDVTIGCFIIHLKNKEDAMMLCLKFS